jgi:hypothetical protein
MKSKKEIMDLISHATGTFAYHRFSPVGGYPVITDGVMAVAQAAGCFWLLDIIGSYQPNAKLGRVFQVWTLKVNRDKSGVVRGYNDATLIITQKIPYTDFPLDEIKLYCIGGVILLPSEY